MRYRSVGDSKLQVSEMGFGLWSLTELGLKLSEGDAVLLLEKAAGLGINLFDAAEKYGNGYSEELLGRAFRKKRDSIIISTKVGYDVVNPATNFLGQKKKEQDFTPAAIRKFTEQALKRLQTEWIDIVQLHHPTEREIENDDIWSELEKLQREGKIREFGITVGPGLGYLYEIIAAIQHRAPAIVQHRMNLFEQYPGNLIERATCHKLPIGADAEDLPNHVHGLTEVEPAFKTKFFIRSPLCSGLLDDMEPANETAFKKRKELAPFTGKETGRTIADLAILWALSDKTAASAFPPITTELDLFRYTLAIDKNPLTAEELLELQSLGAKNFGLKEPGQTYNGRMRR